MAVAFAIVFKQTIKKIPTGKCDGFELLLQKNPCTLTTYLHNVLYLTNLSISEVLVVVFQTTQSKREIYYLAML